MSYMLEPFCEDPSDDIWSMDWLKRAYERNFVNPIISQAWAIDEIESGECTMAELVENLWEGYEKWCDENYMKEYQKEFYE